MLCPLPPRITPTKLLKEEAMSSPVGGAEKRKGKPHEGHLSDGEASPVGGGTLQANTVFTRPEMLCQERSSMIAGSRI